MFHGSFHTNSTSAMCTISDFAQNCTKCAPVGAPVGAMKNPKFQIKIQSGVDFMAF